VGEFAHGQGTQRVGDSDAALRSPGHGKPAARRTGDDDVIGMSGEPGCRAIGRATHKANDGEQTAPMSARLVAGPIELGPLWPGIDQRGPLSLPGRLAGDMRCGLRLVDAAVSD